MKIVDKCYNDKPKTEKLTESYYQLFSAQMFLKDTLLINEN